MKIKETSNKNLKVAPHLKPLQKYAISFFSIYFTFFFVFKEMPENNLL